MSLKAKGRTIFRLFGATLILLDLIITILFHIGLFNNSLLYLSTASLVLPWLLFSIFLKLELNFIISKFKFIFISLIIYSIIIITFTLLWDHSIGILFILNTLSIFLLLSCWYFSLSIYKRKKIIFLLSGLLYILDAIFLSIFMNLLILPILTLEIIIVILGILIILLIEFNLRKRGFLNYI